MISVDALNRVADSHAMLMRQGIWKLSLSKEDGLGGKNMDRVMEEFFSFSASAKVSEGEMAQRGSCNAEHLGTAASP